MKQPTWALMVLACAIAVYSGGEIAPTAQTTAEPATTPITEPTLTPTQVSPAFDLPFLFATKPQPHLASTLFPTGTMQVYMMWRYRNMPRGGTEVRIAWYLNNALWREQTNPWSYKGDGFAFPDSISDGNGLPVGHYRLDVFINGVAQFSEGDEAGRSFDIGGLPMLGGAGLPVTGQGALLSPDGTRAVALEPIGQINLKEKGADWRTLVKGRYVGNLTWLGNDHLLYVFPQSVGGISTLRVADVTIGETWPLNTGEAVVSGPLLVSPDGQFVAGTRDINPGAAGQGDGCAGGAVFVMVFIRLDSTFHSAQIIDINTLAGYPGNPAVSEMFPLIFPYEPGGSVMGTWDSPTQFRAYMSAACSKAEEYVFDLKARTMTRVGNAPSSPFDYP